MIDIKGLYKSFGDFVALDGLDLHVPKGSVYGLVGPNGAGKSTLIRHLAGIYRQDSGEVLIDGEPVYDNPAVKRRVAYIPDDVFYFFQASILDMMHFYHGVYPNFSEERFTRLGQAFALDPKQPFRKMSRGQQKQGAFWLAMSMQPDVIVLDEPLDGLDPVMRRQVWSFIMQDVAEKGTTVLVSSHNLRELEDVCDRVGIVHKGKMLLERGLSELQDNIVKIQLAYPEDRRLPADLQLLHKNEAGRVQQLILRGKPEELTAKLAETNPLFMDLIPLTLEEIFIYELGGADLEVKDILL